MSIYNSSSSLDSQSDYIHVSLDLFHCWSWFETTWFCAVQGDRRHYYIWKVYFSHKTQLIVHRFRFPTLALKSPLLIRVLDVDNFNLFITCSISLYNVVAVFSFCFALFVWRWWIIHLWCLSDDLLVHFFRLSLLFLLWFEFYNFCCRLISWFWTFLFGAVHCNPVIDTPEICIYCFSFSLTPWNLFHDGVSLFLNKSIYSLQYQYSKVLLSSFLDYILHLACIWFRHISTKLLLLEFLCQQSSREH